MDLHEYPRPANDTGLGIHWTVGFASTIGMGKIRDFWIPELKAMGVKWVKIFNHDGAIDFAELLLAEGFMPIVRIHRPSPYPSVFDIRENPTKTVNGKADEFPPMALTWRSKILSLT